MNDPGPPRQTIHGCLHRRLDRRALRARPYISDASTSHRAAPGGDAPCCPGVHGRGPSRREPGRGDRPGGGAAQGAGWPRDRLGDSGRRPLGDRRSCSRAVEGERLLRCGDRRRLPRRYFVADIGLPIFCRFVTPQDMSHGRGAIVGYGRSLTIGGVSVAPDDYIVADSDGAVVVPAALVDEVLERAEALVIKETYFRSALLRGASWKRHLAASSPSEQTALN